MKESPTPKGSKSKDVEKKKKTATKETTAPKKDKKLKEDEKEKGETKDGIVKRNFATNGEVPEPVNKVQWEGALGADFSVRLHTWSGNNRGYINFRKGRALGTNVPAEFYWRVQKALNAMKTDCPGFFPEEDTIDIVDESAQ